MSKLVEWLVPPAGADAEAQRDWQWRVAMAISGAYALGAVLTLAAVGQITGVTGFASATDVVQTQQMVKDLRLDQLRNRMDQKRQQQCVALMDGNTLAMNLAFGQLQQYVDQHIALAGYAYRIPDCGELIPFFSARSPAVPTPSVGR